MPEKIVEVPWDSRTFGLPCYEILDPGEETLKKTAGTRGHHTLKVNPLHSKKALHENGFYYCDTLLEPFCAKKDFVFHEHGSASISKGLSTAELDRISEGAYQHGRFHRDFHVAVSKADARYQRWLHELAGEGRVLALVFEGRTAGYLAHRGPKIVLHALDAAHRGRGISKFLWSAACRELFKNHEELSSSISAANLTAVNLYASLGFNVRNSVDVYHRYVP